MIPILFFGMSFVCDALAVWLILTLIGLIRLRSWARYSVLVIAALMAGFGAISAVDVRRYALFDAEPTRPTNRTDRARDVLRYRRSLRRFRGRLAWRCWSTTTTPQPVPCFLQHRTQRRWARPTPAPARPRPTAITVISWIYLICGPFCLLYLFLPMPTFLFGFIFSWPQGPRPLHCHRPGHCRDRLRPASPAQLSPPRRVLVVCRLPREHPGAADALGQAPVQRIHGH